MAAQMGNTTIAMGTATRNTGAGSTVGPSHQMDRPVVRLLTAMAVMHPNVSSQVISTTDRQPSEMSEMSDRATSTGAGNSLEACGGSKVTMHTVHRLMRPPAGSRSSR